MGVIKRGILGGFSGKVANVIGGSWKGIAYIRSMPLSVANPQTGAQVIQRTKVAKLVKLSQLLLAGIIKPVMDSVASGMSGYNLFVKLNVPNVTSGGTVNYLDMSTGVGTIPDTLIDNEEIKAGSNATLQWDQNFDAQRLATDIIHVVAVNATLGQSVVLPVKTRNDSGSLIAIPASWVAGNTAYFFISWVSANGKHRSALKVIQSNVIS